MFPKRTCDQCGTVTSTYRVCARDTESEETIQLCVHCDDLGQWRRSPYIQGILGRVEASGAAWMARAPFVHRRPPMPPAVLVQEWLADIAVWCAAHDLSLTEMWPRIMTDARDDQTHAEQEYWNDET